MSTGFQLGINYMPRVFQPFLPEQTLHHNCLCFHSAVVWLFNWWHWWYHTRWWGPGCGILSETSLLLVWSYKYIQAEECAGCQIIVPLMWTKWTNFVFLLKYGLKVLSYGVPLDLKSSRHLWKSYSAKFICYKLNTDYSMDEWIEICSSQARHQHSHGPIALLACLAFLSLPIHPDIFIEELSWDLHCPYSLAAISLDGSCMFLHGLGSSQSSGFLSCSKRSMTAPVLQTRRG